LNFFIVKKFSISFQFHILKKRNDFKNKNNNFKKMNIYNSNEKIKLLFVGDVMLGRLVDQIFPTHVEDKEEYQYAQILLKKYNKINQLKELKYKYVWGNLIDIFKNVDLRLINLETSVTTYPKKWPNKAFNYRMHPDNLQILKEVNIDYCSLANNHTLDYCEPGLIETMNSLNKWEIKWAGCGLNNIEAQEPALLNCKNKRIACFSFSDHPKMWSADENKPGINYIDVENHTLNDIERISQLINQKKKRK
jgi:poly-gamma-glutamate capsule biosynthesis protein CapA/YwtB (metallophosphatase superfamily)